MYSWKQAESLMLLNGVSVSIFNKFITGPATNERSQAGTQIDNK